MVVSSSLTNIACNGSTTSVADKRNSAGEPKPEKKGRKPGNRRWQNTIDLMSGQKYEPEGNSAFAEMMVKRQGYRVM